MTRSCSRSTVTKGRCRGYCLPKSKTVLKMPSGTNPLHVPSSWLPEKGQFTVNFHVPAPTRPLLGMQMPSTVIRPELVVPSNGRGLWRSSSDSVKSHLPSGEGTLPPQMPPPTWLDFFIPLPQLPAVSTCQLPSPPSVLFKFVF